MAVPTVTETADRVNAADPVDAAALIDTAALAAAEGITLPPSNLWSDEPPLESDFHRDQIDLLIRLLRHWWADREDVYISGNLTIYYNQQQIKTRDFRGPDFFVVLGTEKKDRRSWAIWDEQGKYPNLILEILSDSTKSVDQGLKKDLYQNTFRTPDYFWFDPYTQEFQGFHLVDGVYEPIPATAEGRLWSQQLSLYLGVWENRLRFFTAEGDLIPSPEELAAQERQRADQAEQELAALKAKLKAQGIELED